MSKEVKILKITIAIALPILAVLSVLLFFKACASEIEAYFTPSNACKTAILKHIKEEKEAIYVSSYSFTDADIAKALIKANDRDVRVEVVMDKLQSKSKHQVSIVRMLEGNDIQVILNNGVKIEHNKVMLFQGQNLTQTGSFNYSVNASKSNAENCLFIKDTGVYVKYKKDFLNRQTKYKHGG